MSWSDRLTSSLTPNYRPAPLTFVRGEGCYLTSVEGRRYLDLTAGIAVNALGHSHPRFVRALREQAEKLTHISNLFINPPAVELAEALCARSFADRVYFGNSGAEANEAALKMARRYMSSVKGMPERYEIICAQHSFHGRTWAAISATGQPKYHKGFEPLVPGFIHVPYNDIDAIERAITPNTCAVLLEPIQGEGGVIEANDGYLKAVRSSCDQAGILLIFDEVQTGIGRTGNWFAHQFEGVSPDIMSLAKGLGGGVPIGATLCTEEASKGFAPGVHASTYGGNPLVCAVSKEVISVIEDEGLIQHSIDMGHRLADGFDQLISKYDFLVSQRGRGLLRGLVTRENIDRKSILAAARDQGVLITTAGSDTLRICPPLIIGAGEIDEGLERLDHALETVATQILD